MSFLFLRAKARKYSLKVTMYRAMMLSLGAERIPESK